MLSGRHIGVFLGTVLAVATTAPAGAAPGETGGATQRRDTMHANFPPIPGVRAGRAASGKGQRDYKEAKAQLQRAEQLMNKLAGQVQRARNAHGPRARDTRNSAAYQADRIAHDVDVTLARVDRALSRISAADRALLDVGKLEKERDEIRAGKKKLLAMVHGSAQAAQAAKGKCVEVRRDPAIPFLAPTRSGFVVKHGGKKWAQKYMEAARGFRQRVCDNPKYRDLAEGKAVCSDVDVRKACDNARHPERAVAEALVQQGLQKVQVTARNLRHMVGRVRRDGWIPDDHPLSWSEIAGGNIDSMVDRAVEDIHKDFQEVGIAPPADLRERVVKLAEPMRKAYAELAKAIEETASRWKLEPKGKKFYGVDMLRRAVKKTFPSAKIITAYGRPGQWTYRKTAVGLPDERTRSAYILFREKGAPYCQYWRVTVNEPYKGGGKYARADHVHLEAYRFQSCR